MALTPMQAVDRYLAAQPEPHRALLQKVRAQIRAAAPKAEEKISYGMPAFTLHGHGLVAYAGFKKHCSVFPMGYVTVLSSIPELKKFSHLKGTLRFTVEEPIPAALMKKLVKVRAAQNLERAAAKKAKKKPARG